MSKNISYPQQESYPYRITINEYQKAIESQQSLINQQQKEIIRLSNELKSLSEESQNISKQLQDILNSKGWRTIEKIRKFLPSTTIKTIKASQLPTAKPATNTPIPPQLNSYYYDSHYEENIDFSSLGYQPEAKAIAFYLPQFYAFPENDRWWGKGFTEWTNTQKATPKFNGHYQPREPHDEIGYYTLDNVDIIKKQVTLAKQHGIYGFCFYYYWFSGKRLLEKPIDIFLQHKDINFPFCLCWANENWTKTWDGLDKDILIAQKYQEKDPVNFIKDLKKYLDDPRYIRVNNKPVILVYAPNSIPDFAKTVRIWRETARRLGIGEILVWSKNTTLDHDFKNTSFVDAEFDFAPTGQTFHNSFIKSNDEHTLLDYSKLVQDYKNRHLYYNHFPIKPFYYSCTLGWDNSPRRKKGYCALVNYSTAEFYNWLHLVIEETKRRYPKDQCFVFINAWNEWGEGTYLEPDKKFGYTNINTAAKAIYGLPYHSTKDLIILDKNSPKNFTLKKIAIQIHAFYPDVLDDILRPLSKLNFKIDIYISTNSQDKITLIKNQLKKYHLNAQKIEILPNVGRDVFPFISQMNKIYNKYDIIGHFHTKKTPQSFYGDAWRNQIYQSLLDSPENIQRIFSLFNNPKIGIIAPDYFYHIRGSIAIGSNLSIINELLTRMELKRINSKTKIDFPAGTMFWGKSKSLAKIFELNLAQADFSEEANQADGTTAHALERLFGIVPQQEGYCIKRILNKS